MPASRNNIARRIAVLAATVRPADSLQARLEKLTPIQAAMFHAHRERYDRWTARHAGENLYAAMIDDPPPNLPSALRAALFPDHAEIIEGDSADTAQRKYQELLERAR